MRPLTTALIALVPCLPALADTADWIRAQRGVAGTRLSEGKRAEAIETIRIALAAARQARLRTEASECVSFLGWMRRSEEAEALSKGDTPARLAKALFREAAREAAAAGDTALECECLNAAAMGEEPEDAALTAQRVDAATACSDLVTLGNIAFSADISPSLPILDLLAEAAVAEARGDADSAARALTAAAEASETAGLKRCAAAAAVRLAKAGNDRGRSDDALTHANAAFAKFDALKNLRGAAEARLERGRALAAKGDANARKELQTALNEALDLYDAELEVRALQALAAQAPPAEKPGLLTRAGQAEMRRHAGVLEAAERAAREGEATDVAADRLRAERTRRPDTSAEIDRVLATLGQPAIPPRKEIPVAQRDRLKALLSSNAVRILIGLEILRRHDAWPLIAEAGAKSAFPWVYANALETLATREDFAALLGLVGSKDALFAEAAAAAAFRLATPADAPAVTKALDVKPVPAAALYLQGVLARGGDGAALKNLRTALAGEDNVNAHHAAVVLGQLGFGSSHLRIADRSWDLDPVLRGRILARSPAAWGIVWARPGGESEGAIQIARANHVRRMKHRGMTIDHAGNIWELMYLLPATPEESRLCGNAWLLRTAALVKEDLSGDMLTWVAGGLGYDMYGGEARLGVHKERNEAAFALEDLEAHRLGEVAGTQTRVLSVMTGSAWARIRCTATPEMGLIVDNTIQLPFEVVYGMVDGTGGGFLGALDKITLQITLSTLVTEATLRIPGYEPFLANVKPDQGNRVWVYANLPVELGGAGLEPGKVVPLDKLAQGTVTLSLAVEDSRASMTFPLAVLVPPAKDKPDLVAVDLTVQPAVPRIGEEAQLRLRTRNAGKSIDDAGLLLVHFEVRNPQDAGGKRTIDVRLTEAKGWRAGEWRYFEARPTAIRGWYMNAWSHTWTLEMGDTRLIGAVDVDGKVAEEAEDNNAVELEVPLRLDEEEGKRLAEDEILERMTALLRAVGEAKTEEQARGPGYEALGMLGRARTSTPAIELARRHLQAAVETQIHRVRVRAALERARSLARDPRANQEALREIMAELTDAETDLMDTGVPVKEDTITWWRNRVQVTANVLGAGKDYAELAGVFGGPDDLMPENLKTVGENLNRLDGALQCIRYVRDRADGGEYDNADAIEGTVKLFGGGAPGMSNLHQALFKAEIDYVDRGFRKEANALDALAALISGEAGAQERLDAAVRDVEVHVTAGPFNEAAQKEIMQGWAKDIPFAGKLLDAWWSWK